MLACYHGYGEMWVELLRTYPFLHSWLFVLVLWAVVRLGFGKFGEGPMRPGLYLIGALWGVAVDPGLCVPALPVFVLRLFWTSCSDDPRMWLVSPLYHAFHRAVTAVVVLAVPGAFLRYHLQSPIHTVGLDAGLVPWLFGLGVTLLASAFALARWKPELLGEPPAGLQALLNQRAARRARRIVPALRKVPKGPQPVSVAETQRCPLCHDALAQVDLTVCVGCETVAHRACTAEFNGCGTLGCAGVRTPRVVRSSSVQLVLQPVGGLAQVQAAVLAG